jgi:hypothetical protein
MRQYERKIMRNGGVYEMTAARMLGNLRAADKRRGIRFVPLKVHQHAHRLVRDFTEILNAERITLNEIERRAGISRCVMHKWRIRSNPTIAMLDAALNSIGYELKIVRAKDAEE